ncbi:MAG: TRAP transporter large permease [Synergistaceae bacterium]|nr:TRAP transporter large permease [Synergistaceae bacterium]MBQ3449449.1 TRAP transporter large permease [Synergistaceae bacterium]MBQ9629262.1 TRAP transporter large permease [Synergistaceae bacterium]MBR0250938.1 TRAP transporter large permease [Synergistaceae bacterium]
MYGIILFLGFILQMLIGVPLYAALLMTSLLGLLGTGNITLLRVIPQQFYGGMDSFTLLALPFFILTGNLMNRSGLTDRLIDFSRLIVGRVRGGLGYVNVVGSVVFAGVNGSAAADSSALGSILIPAMVKEGFPAAYSAGITAASSLIGPIIPPSMFMIIYASLTNTSIGGLFAAGFIPGLILGIAYMIMNWFYSRKYNVPVTDIEEVYKSKWQILRRSVMALIAPLIIMGGIIEGFVTPTESGALACVYCVIVGFFVTRELTLKSLCMALYESIRSTAAVFLIMGAASVVGWYMKYERITQAFSALIMNSGLMTHPFMLMLVLSAITFIIGMFMEEIAVLTLLTPVFYPLAMRAGINPFQFGVVMTLNVTIALITPPVGACNYIVAAIGHVPIGELFREIWPFIMVALAVLIIIISFPFLTSIIPALMGL